MSPVLVLPRLLLVATIVSGILVSADLALASPKLGTQTLLLPKGAKYSYRVESNQLPEFRFGMILKQDYSAIHISPRENAASEKAMPIPPLPQAAARWPKEGLAKGSSGLAPFASSPGKEKACKCKTFLGDSTKRRPSVFFATTEFTVPEGQFADKRVLLRVQYNDGMRLYLNGRLVAERNWLRGDNWARRRAGPEWEELRIPWSESGLRVGNNRLSVEVVPWRGSAQLRFDAEVSVVPKASILQGPIVQLEKGGESLSLLFSTDKPSFAKVLIEDKVYSASGGALARHHQVSLRGLKQGRSFKYKVVVDDVVAATAYSLSTPPGESEPLTFAVYGDMRGGHQVHSTIVDSIISEGVDLVLVTGDLVLRGSDEGDWQTFFSVAGRLLSQVPYLVASGNHDLGPAGEEGRRIAERFLMSPRKLNLPEAPSSKRVTASWYSLKVAGIAFVFVDSNRLRDPQQLLWLEKDLASHQGAQATFVLMHAGPYSRGLHKGNAFAARYYAPLFRKYGVTMLFSGHDHLYQRGSVEGLDYIVSGGGGAPLYKVSCGGAKRKPCKQKDGMKKVLRAQHYVVVTVLPRYLSVCPKSVTGGPLEPCMRYPLPSR